MRHKFFILFLVLAACLSVPISHAQSPSSQDAISLSRLASYLEDPSASLDLAEILSATQRNRFLPVPSDPIHFGLTRSVYWFQIDLNHLGVESQHGRVLEIGPPKHVEGIARGGTDVFLFAGDGSLLMSTRLGSYASAEELRTLQGGYALRLHSDTRGILIRVETARELRLPLTLWQEHAFRAQEINANTGFGIQYGILIAMIFYNLFLFISIRERSFLFYVFAIFTQLAFLFLDSKHARLVNESGMFNPWFINMLERNVYTLMGLAHLQFQRHLLQIWQWNPTLDRLYKGLMGLFLFALLLSLIPDEKLAQSVYVPLIILGLVLALYTNIDAIRKGSDTAVVHLVAMGALVMGVGVRVMHQVFGLLPSHWLVEQAFEIGMIAQALLLSFGLAFRYNAMKKEKESAQRDAISHLERSEKLKDELLANVSHELRTPIHGINGLAEIALDQMDNQPIPAEDIKEKLRLITSSGNRLIGLVDDLLDISSLRDHKIALDRHSVDIYAMVSEILSTANILKGARRITIHNLVDPELPPVFADRDRLHQILLNLITNAVKFTPEGDVWISATRSGENNITIAIKDNGIGIRPDDLQRIFNPFEKGLSPGSIDIGQGGAGLGLAISRHLVELHGSSLDVYSSPGAGSVFSFSLPLANEQSSLMSSASVTANSRLLRRADYGDISLPRDDGIVMEDAVILIVDDDPVNRRVVAEQLRHYRVLQASDGSEALRMVNEFRPDLVLLDLMMPGMSGYEVCAELRNQFDETELPVIIVTAKNHLEDLTEGFRTGANDYLAKPFHMEELRARVGSQLKLAQLNKVNTENVRLRQHIQEYVKANQELRASRSQLENVLDSIPTAAIALSYPGIIVHINPLGSDLLRTVPDTLTGKPMAALLSKDSCNAQLEALIARWEAGENITVDEQQILLDIALPDCPDAVRLRGRFVAMGGDDSISILFLERLQGSVTWNSSFDEPALLKALSDVQQDLRRLNSRIKLLTTVELKEHPAIMEHFANVTAMLAYLDELVDSDAAKENYREQLVKLMQMTLDTWEQTTGKSKIDLAESSRIWAVSIDDGRLRTRTFDRYLRVDLLPRVPRWREVIRTTYFVLSDHSINPDVRSRLEQELERTKTVLQQNALA